MLDYLILVFSSTGLQILLLFGPLLILGMLMHFISGWNEKLSIRLIGRNGYLWLFGWLGTSLHEIGHALFAVMFGHRIEEIKLFAPDPASGTLGYVRHSWNRKNLFHIAGNFFIGTGPIILGTLILLALVFLLYGEAVLHIVPLKDYSAGSVFMLLTDNMLWFLGIVFNGSQSQWWKTLILIYILFSIGGSVKLSKPDITGAASGFLFFVALLLIFNAATVWYGNFMTLAVEWLSGILTGFYLLQIISLAVNLSFVLITGFLLIMKSLI